MRPDEIQLYLIMFLIVGPFFVLGIYIGTQFAAPIERFSKWTLRKIERKLNLA